MTPDIVLDMMLDAFKTALLLALPVMLATLIVGVVISVFQSVTSIQEQTMVFVPKIVAVVVALLVLFSWMMNTVIHYTQTLFISIPDLLK